MAGRPGAPKQSKRAKQQSARAGRRQAANAAKATKTPKPGLARRAIGVAARHPKTTSIGVGVAVGAGVANHINSQRRSAHQGIDTKSQQHWNGPVKSNSIVGTAMSKKGYQNSTDGYG